MFQKDEIAEASARCLAPCSPAMLSAIPGGVAVLDHSGQIIQTNPAWATQFSVFERSAEVGDSFLETCELAADSGSHSAELLAEGLREVLSGRRPNFSLEYQSPSAQEKWYSTCLRTLHAHGRGYFVVFHSELAPRTGAPTGREAAATEPAACKCSSPELNLEEASAMKPFPNVALYQLEVPHGQAGFFTRTQGLTEMFGFSSRLGPIRSDVLEDFIHPEDRGTFRQAREKAAAECSGFEQHPRLLLPDGTIKWTRWNATANRMPTGTVIWNGVIIEITAQKLSENELKRAYRTLKAIKACNQTLANASDETEMLAGVCSCLVNIGGAKLAWVGLAEKDRRKHVRILASAGDDRGHLQKAKLTWAKSPRGGEPIGITIRSGEMTICRDVAHDPRLGPFRKLLAHHGVASFLCLPLVVDKDCIGALTVCASNRDTFRGEETKLLSQLADEIGLGIEALRLRNEKELAAQEMLRISEKEKKIVAQEMHEGLCQHLAGTAVMGSVLQRRMAARNDPEAGAIGQICEHLNLGASQARTLSRGLQPVRENPEGLMEALSGLASSTSKLHQIRCDFECDPSVSVENPSAGTHLFKIAQEAVQNSIRKGNAKRIQIRLENFSQRLELSIRDDAEEPPCSTPCANTQKRKNMEIRTMRHRALVIGAKLRVYSNSQGTLVRCSLPLQEQL